MIVGDWAKSLLEFGRRKLGKSQQDFAELSSAKEPEKIIRRKRSLPPLRKNHGTFSASTYGGSYGAIVNDGSKFDTGLAPSGAGNIFDHTTLLQNARTAYSESLQARGIVRRYADTVVDTGIRLLPTPKISILGITPEAAEVWADDVAQRFDCWFASKQCTLDEVNNGYQIERLIEIQTRRDGEYFMRFHYSRRKDLINPLQLSIVDPTQIAGYGYTDTYGYNRTYSDGIIRDRGGKEIAYKVWTVTDREAKQVTIPAIGARSGRRLMLHGYSPEYAGQGRGMSDFAHALQDFSNITGFSQAQIMKAISQSQYNFKVVPSKDAPASNPLEPEAGFSYDRNYAETQVDPTTGELNRLIYSRLPEVSASIPGATALFGLQSGEDFEAIENSAPVEQFANFVNALSTYLTSSCSMPLQVLTMQFDRSYTASMGALILFWRVAEIARSEQAADWLNYVYEAWLFGEIAAGRVSAPGWLDPILKSAWLSARWGGAPMPIIDPSKQSKADKDYVELGSQHLDDVARNYNGSDGRLNRAKLKTQLEELPTVPWSKGSTTAPASTSDSGGDDQDDQGERDE
jgi:capsid protein